MTLLLTNDEVERLVTMRECLDVMERAYAELGQGVGVSRTVSQIFSPTAHAQDAVYALKSMDGVVPFLGVAAIRLTSEILTWPKDASGRAKKVRIGAAANGRFIGLVMLFSTTTGEPLAIFPDGIVQRLRVGATTGLAAKYLARADATEVAMLGCGHQAHAQILAIAEVRKVRRVRCYSPNAEKRVAFAWDMAERTGIAIEASPSPQQAVRGADMVLCATNSFSPVCLADWIEPGVHVSSIARRARAENVRQGRCAGRALHRRTAGHDRCEPRRHPGRGNRAMRRAVRAALAERQLPNLYDLVLGRAQGRTAPQQVSCFLNYVGLGYQFAAVGAIVHRNAHAQGIGRELPTDWFTEDVNP